LESVPADFRKPDGIRDEVYGSYFVEGDPDEFYHRARTDCDLVLIKAHTLPRDAEKAIYVVRDGRLALKSFVEFTARYHPGVSTYESLLVGDHPYGEWTSHYRAWCERESGETLVVRFEELLHADSALLARLAAFLGLPGPLRPWVNPQAQLRERDPAFFGTGKAAWRPDEFWTESRLRPFYTLHGPLLVRLGYASAAEVEARAYPEGSDEERFVQFVRSLVLDRNALQKAYATLTRMQRLCTEQAEEMAALYEECAARDRSLSELTQQWESEARASNRALEMALRNLESASRQLEAATARIDELHSHCLYLERRLWWRRLPLYKFLSRLVRR
jgi:hypothetical protein